jgi:hypothetical protein
MADLNAVPADPIGPAVVDKIDRAAGLLEAAGQVPHFAYGWLALARTRVRCGLEGQAFESLDELRVLARCFGMKVQEIDGHLVTAELAHFQAERGDGPDRLRLAIRALAEAEPLLHATGYARGLERWRMLMARVERTSARAEGPRRSAEGAEAFKRLRVFSSALLAYAHLGKFIRRLSQPVSECLMIQYRGEFSRGLVRRLLQKNVNVTVYLQHPGGALLLGAGQQSERLYHAPHELIDELNYDARHPARLGQLQVYRYFAPASLCGVRIDRKVLLLSWYTHSLLKNWDEAPQTRRDLIGVRGHDNAAVVVYGDSPKAFQRLDDMFERQLGLLAASEPRLVDPSPFESAWPIVDAEKREAVAMIQRFHQWHEQHKLG